MEHSLIGVLSEKKQFHFIQSRQISEITTEPTHVLSNVIQEPLHNIQDILEITMDRPMSFVKPKERNQSGSQVVNKSNVMDVNHQQVLFYLIAQVRVRSILCVQPSAPMEMLENGELDVRKRKENTTGIHFMIKLSMPVHRAINFRLSNQLPVPARDPHYIAQVPTYVILYYILVVTSQILEISILELTLRLFSRDPCSTPFDPI